MLRAVKFSLDVGLWRIEVYLSYKDLLTMLKATNTCLAPIGTLVDDILFVRQHFPFCQFSFVKSMCNTAVLALATEALLSISTQV